jgi:hypothetical protein
VKQLVELRVIDEKTRVFRLCLGESLIEKTNEFCSDDIVCSFLVLKSTLTVLLEAFPTDVAINYLDTNQINKVFKLSAGNGSLLEETLLEICTEKNLPERDSQCMQLSSMFLRASWSIVDLAIRRVHEDFFLDLARSLAKDDNVVFLIEPPSPFQYPPGIGNVLKGFLNSYSLHDNTKIKNIDGYVLGNYSSILNSRHIYSEKVSTSIENTYSWRLHVTKEEELALHNTSLGRFMIGQLQVPADRPQDHFNNPNLHVMFSTSISIDGRFDRTIFPQSTARRILAAVHGTIFQPGVYAAVQELVVRLLHPSLGVSVR